MSFKEKIRSWRFYKALDNFWYHYKVPALIFGVLGIFLLVCIIQTATRESFDVSVFYAGPRLLSEDEVSSAKDALSDMMRDGYEEEKGSASFKYMCVMSDEQIDEAVEKVPEEDRESQRLYYSSNYSHRVTLSNFYSEIFAGEAMIAFVDGELYELVKEKGGLYSLEEVLGEVPGNAFDDYGIRLHDTDAVFFGVFASMPADTVICMRRPSSTSVLKPKSEEEKRYLFSVQLLKDILAFEAPEA